MGRPFEQSDNVKVVKSVNKNNANFMVTTLSVRSNAMPVNLGTLFARQT